jgi:ABC-type nitrate/sulfonate/bicarbonate transport system permease component/ABC-type nitrate/sulfonate/bicarbonate transport system substrate-binding protein
VRIVFRWRGWTQLVLPLALVSLVFAIWEAVIKLFTIAPYVLPSPSAVFSAMSDDWDVLQGYTFTTLKEFVFGFVVGIAIGFVLAVVMAHSRIVQRGLYPLLIASQAVPIIAIAAALTIWLGFGLTPKIVIVALIVFFPVVVNVLDGLANVDRDAIALARAMGASPARIFLHIRLPATLTPLFSALKLAATFSVTGAVLGEWVASTNGGLGVYLLEQNGRLNTAGVFASILLLSAIGIAGFLVVAIVEQLATPWRTRSTPRHLSPFRRRKTMKARLGALATLVVVLALVAAVYGGFSSTSKASSRSPKLTTIRMVQEWPVADAFWTPWVVAEQKGWYRQAGIDLKIIPPPTVADTIKFVGTGRADIGFTTILDVIFAKEQGAPVISIGNYSQSNNWGLIGRQGEKVTVAGLKGKTVGIYNDAWTKAQLSIMLKSAHLTLKDIKTVAAASDVVPLLLAKKVDVATGVTNAEASEVRTTGHQKPVILLAKDYGVPNSPIWLFAANTGWLKKNPALTKKWFAVTRRGVQWSIAHPKQAVQIWLKAYPKAAPLDYALDSWKSTIPLFRSPHGYFNQQASQWSALLPALKQQKLIKKALPPNQYFTNAYNGTK